MAKDLSAALKMEAQDVKDCVKKVKFTADKSTVAGEAARATANFANYANIPGFRRGKAPAGMLRTKHAAEITEEMKRHIISTGFEKASKELDVLGCTIDGDPAIDFDKEFSFTLNFEVAPAIELGEYKGLDVKAEVKTISDKDVEDRIKMYRSMYANYADSDDAAQADDMLKVSYKSDFVLADDAPASLKRQVESETNYIWLKEPESIPGAVNALTGVKTGETREVIANYPADYREAALAGKKVVYQVTVNAVQHRKDLDDVELIERVKAPSMDEFKKMLKESMEQEIESENRQKLCDATFEVLDKKVAKFDLPVNLLGSETDRELRRLADTMIKSEADAEAFKKDVEKHRKDAGETAKKALRRNLILRKIGKLENISVDAEEMDEQVKVMSRYYGYKAKDFQSMLLKSGGMDELQFNMVSAKVLSFLADNAKK